MENLLDMLIPIIVVVGWVLKGLFTSNSEEDEGAPRPRSAPKESYPDTEYEERQRRIQEEIRRKIMERRQAAEGAGADAPVQSQQQRPVVMSSDHAEAKRRRVQERLKERQERHKETAERVHETQAESDVAPGGFSWDESDHAYEQALEAQRARIEETKRQAVQLQSLLASKSQQQDGATTLKRQRTSYRGPIRSKLRNPAAARDAIVYSEVLGKPVGLREG